MLVTYPAVVAGGFTVVPGDGTSHFGLVLSHIGSFTNIRGGWAYPGLVRKTKDKPKAIKVYLQDGKDDLNNLHGNDIAGGQDLRSRADSLTHALIGQRRARPAQFAQRN